MSQSIIRFSSPLLGFIHINNMVVCLFSRVEPTHSCWLSVVTSLLCQQRYQSFLKVRSIEFLRRCSLILLNFIKIWVYQIFYHVLKYTWEVGRRGLLWLSFRDIKGISLSHNEVLWMKFILLYISNFSFSCFFLYSTFFIDFFNFFEIIIVGFTQCILNKDLSFFL